MNKLKELWQKTLCYHFYREFWIRYRFKYVLPRVREIVLDGLRLDVSGLPVKVRNRLMLGGYEAHEKRMCRDYLSASDSVLEIGGAIGYIGMYCQRELGIRRYYCFEANPRTVEILKTNYRLNNLAPAIWNMALAERDGEVELDVGGDFWENTIVAKASAGEARQAIAVPAGSLRTLLSMAGAPVNVLIIDIEGAEQYIDFAEIPGEIEKIIIELHPAMLGAQRMYDLIGALIQRGFHVAREEEGTFVFLREREPREMGRRAARKEEALEAPFPAAGVAA